MALFNRVCVSILAMLVAVAALALLLLPLDTLDTLSHVVAYLRAQALIYRGGTLLVALALLLGALVLLAAELIERRPTLIPIRRLGAGYAELSLHIVERTAAATLAQVPGVATGRVRMRGHGEGVTITLTLDLREDAHALETVAAAHAALRQAIEERLGVRVLDLSSQVVGGGGATTLSSPVTPARSQVTTGDSRELRRRIERAVLNQPGVADMETLLQCDDAGVTLGLRLVAANDAPVLELVARIEHLVRGIIEQEFRLPVCDLHVAVVDMQVKRS